MPKVEATCPQCGKTFQYYPSMRPGKTLTCSATCSSRYAPRKPHTGEYRNCTVCGKHFYRTRTGLAKNPLYCSVACHNVGQTKDATVKTCALEGCDVAMHLKPSQAHRQYCSKAHEGLARIKRPQERLHNGRPTKCDNYGYLMVWEPEHPNKAMKGWQYEHRIIMEKQLGRYLQSDEHVDHINDVKGDNRPENLQVLSRSAHSAKTGADKRRKKAEIQAELDAYRERYGPLKE